MASAAKKSGRRREMKNPSSEDQRMGITVRTHQEIVKERIELKDNKGMCRSWALTFRFY
jgi:hypothetical protein